MAKATAKLVFWQEILPGDLLKMRAESSPAGTGGGARDLRFPDKPFRPILQQMFPRLRPGTQIRLGDLVWDGSLGTAQSQEIEYWPPTSARPNEGRLAKIHSLDALRDPPDPRGERLILVLVLDSAQELRAYYATPSVLHKWHDDVARPILDCLSARRAANVAARGWIDLTTSRKYCHGS